MDLDKSRVKFWNEFLIFKDKKGKSSIFNELTKVPYKKTHAIPVYNRNDLSLKIGINKKHARCSLHIMCDNLEGVYSHLAKLKEKLYKQFQMKRDPELTIKRNPKSIVVFLKDYSYRFPPSSADEKEALMEWMYQNAIVMNKVPVYLRMETFEKPMKKEVRNLTPSVSKAKVSQINTKDFHTRNINDLANKIYKCNNKCKKPKDQMLLGHDIGDPGNIELMIIGIGPNETYAKKEKNRSVFGPYGNSGKKVKSLVSIIKKKRGSLTCWVTNAIKCDHNKENEKATIFQCKKFLLQEIEIINPKVIVLFGARLSNIFLSKPLLHGGVNKLFDKYLCIQSVHPASRASYASGKRFDEKNIELLANKIIEYL
jgi:uracil-DNA glycosylase family 4